MDLGMICDVIILVAAVLGAIGGIWKFILNSGKGIKKTVNKVAEDKEAEFNARVDARIKEKVQPMIDSAVRTLTASFEGLLDKHLPERLEAHDLETRDKYRADRYRYLCEIKDEVVKVMGDKMAAIETHDEQMNVFTQVLKELLRE